MDAAAFARAVTDRMQGANEGRRTNFTTTPGKSAEKNLRVVMAFNAAPGGYDLCDGKAIETKPRKDVLALSAAWCFGDRQDSMVAEKNRVWRILGRKETIRSTSGMNPMSSMRSASSMTKILTPLRRMRPKLWRPSRRAPSLISSPA